MPTAEQVLSQAPLYTDEQLYRLIHLPPRAITAAAGVLAEVGTAFSTLVVDKDEVTLLLPEDDWGFFANRLPDHRAAGLFRLITFDLVLEPTLIGFMALVTRLLADAEISILAVSAFERDHILIPAAQFDMAWKVLKTAQNSSK
ncbi:MAG TPA: ACT domain-containing protein [Aggregatilineaceae bacterium]|nr:ACT domain-containing protein [Aggregatilineaceae bacterium]